MSLSKEKFWLILGCIITAITLGIIKIFNIDAHNNMTASLFFLLILLPLSIGGVMYSKRIYKEKKKRCFLVIGIIIVAWAALIGSTVLILAGKIH